MKLAPSVNFTNILQASFFCTEVKQLFRPYVLSLAFFGGSMQISEKNSF